VCGAQIDWDEGSIKFLASSVPNLKVNAVALNVDYEFLAVAADRGFLSEKGFAVDFPMDQ
jgi:hypothetical protein